MQLYGKTAGNAVAAMSYLAEVYGPDAPLVATLDIVNAREISRPLLGKILTTLSQAGLVVGSPGPNGGFTLAKPPHEITLNEIVREFDRMDRPVSCPFGPNWCGNEAPCPLHDELVKFRERSLEFLETTTLAVFSEASKKDRKGDA